MKTHKFDSELKMTEHYLITFLFVVSYVLCVHLHMYESPFEFCS